MIKIKLYCEVCDAFYEVKQNKCSNCGSLLIRCKKIIKGGKKHEERY